jgi:hypothetical protein
VVRDGKVLEPDVAWNLRQGDYAYFLIPPGRAADLDRAVAPAAAGDG